MTLVRPLLAIVLPALLLACAPTPDAASAPPQAATTTTQATPGLAWHRVATDPPPTARHENAFVALDGKLYLLGGRDARPLDIFDPATGQWRTGTAPPLELHHTQAVAHAGRIWIIGALTGGFPDEPSVPSVWTYDPVADTWHEGASIPEARRRGAAGLVVHEDKLYLVGGTTGGHRQGAVGWLDRFDPATGEWQALADAPHARDHLHAAVLDGQLYLAGGRRSAFGPGVSGITSVPEVDVYDIAADQWRTLAAPLPTLRSGHAAIAHDGRLLVIGGESDAQQRAHDEVDAYDPATDTWTRWPSLPVGRHGTQATVLDGAVHIVAGSGDRGGGPELADHFVLQPAQ